MIGFILARELLRLFVFFAATRVGLRVVLRFVPEPVPASTLDTAGTWVIRAGVAFVAARLVGYV